jgi:glycosyltransferase involved in cell wall biosynthesis
MRVMHFISSKGMGQGEMYIDLVNELCKNIEVILLIPKDALYKNRIDEKIEIIEYSMYNSRNNPLLLFELWWKIKVTKPDIVHTHFAKATEIFTKINILPQLLHVATKHNPRKAKIFNRLNHVIAVSKGVKESIDNKSVQVIYNGIKATELLPSIKNEMFTLLAIGRLDKVKGFDILIKECLKLNFPYKLYIVGEGKQREYLEAQIIKYNLENNVELLGFRKEIPQLIKNADLVVVSSHSEGFSLVIVEAFFYAKVLITREVGIASELPLQKYIINEFEIAKKIKEVHDNYQNYVDDFASLKAVYQKRFQLQNCVKQHIDYYQNIINKK